MKRPNLLFADKNGKIYDHPFLKMVTSRWGNEPFVAYSKEDFIELPSCSRLYFIPGTKAIGWDEKYKRYVELKDKHCVSAFLSPGYLRLLNPMYKKVSRGILPLYAYTPVGFLEGKFVVPAIKVDDDSRWNPLNYDFTDKFKERVTVLLNKYPKNRLYKQLSTCALIYHCTAAKNVFEQRWECPIPTSPTCNSRCVGCISKQPAECCPSPQERINFIPSHEEIAEVALNHYAVAEHPIISFGQGCEGDPIMVADVIAKAVKIIKRRAPKLTINFNSNCSIPDRIRLLADSGVDSVRVSTISFREKTYNAYYNPVGYNLGEVIESIKIAKERGLYISINLLTFPGLTDRKDEVDATSEAVDKYDINLVQTRNLNIDQDLLFSKLPPPDTEIIGIRRMLKKMLSANPRLKIGYFNKTKDEFFAP